MQFNFPICITIFRIILIPFFTLIFYFPFDSCKLVSAIIFLIASITDWIDGFLARKLKQTTKFGKFLDPVADKIVVIISLIIIIEHFHIWFITFPASIIIVREIIISALREWMAKIGKSKKVSVSLIGKIKTFIQMLSLFSLLWEPNVFIKIMGIIILYIASIITLFSMINYFKLAYK